MLPSQLTREAPSTGTRDRGNLRFAFYLCPYKDKLELIVIDAANPTAKFQVPISFPNAKEADRVWEEIGQQTREPIGS